MTKKRFKYALKLAALHLLASIIVALLAATLVWFGWYSWPYSQILKVSGLYQLVIIVDVICGPLLTFVLGNPTKSHKETAIDISLVAIIQIAALAYGLHSLYLVRPVAVVFEVDRFVILSTGDISSQRSFPILGISQFAQKEPESTDERLAMLDFALQGRTTASNSVWWLEHSDETRNKILKRAKTLEQLSRSQPDKMTIIEDISSKHGLPKDQLLFLPTVTTTNFGWISILNPDGHVIDYAEISGFK